MLGVFLAPAAVVLAAEELLTVGEVELSVSAEVGQFRDALEAEAVVLQVGEAVGCLQEV